jgi:membrane associated rhomboid family serine protease
MTTMEYRPQTPPAVQNLLIANCVVFLAMMLLDENRIYELFALFPAPSPWFKFWQPVTYMFMHGDFSHLFFNMFALWMFGRGLEQELGTKRFLTYYMVCGIGAGLVQLGMAQIDLMRLSEVSIAYQQYLWTPTVGASGAVFGLLLAFGMLHPNATIMPLIPPIPMKAKWFVIIYGLLELLFGISGRMDSVAHFAHLGGMFWGWLLLIWWRYQDTKRYRY